MLKRKTNIFVTILFTFVAFMLIGTTNVNAATVTVTTEEELRNALSGNDSSITEVKLGANIEITGRDLVIYPVNDLVLDLVGNTIDGKNASRSIEIQYGKNSLTSGSLTIEDSGSSAGSIKSYNNITVCNNNSDTSAEKNYSLNIESGQFYVQGGTWSNNVFYMKNSFANRNVNFHFQVKDGYFEKNYNFGGFLALEDELTNDSVNLNINLDKLIFYSTNNFNYALIYSYSNAYTTNLSDVVSSSSNVVLQRGTETGPIATVTNLDVSATSYEELNKVLTSYTTIKIIKTEGFDVSDVTLNETYGYTLPTATSILIKNRGTNSLQVKSVTISGEDADKFALSGDTQPTINSGETNSGDFSITPVIGLNAGEYTATIIVTDINNKTYTATVTLNVAKQTLEGITITQADWNYDGKAHTNYTLPVGSLSSSQYKIEYSVSGENSWSETVPKKVGKYTIRLTVTDSNLTSEPATCDFEIKKNDTQIKIVANSNAWNYDGDSHSDNGYKVFYGDTEITSGELPTGDAISAVVSGSVRDVKDTKTANNKIISYTIANRDSYSNVTSGDGTLTINPITTPIIVTANSETKSYDGNALKVSTYTFTDGVLLSGDTLDVTISGEQTYVGQSANKVESVKVMRGSENITSNYTFGAHVNGTLKVNPIDQPLSITDQYVTVNSKLFTSALEQELTGAEGNVSFEVKSGTAGEYNEELYGGFLAGASSGDVTMTAKATAFDVNGDGTPEYNATEKDFIIHVVTKQTVTFSGITDNQTFTYDGTPKTPSGEIVVSVASSIDLEVSYHGTGSTTYSGENAPTKVGTYSVTYKVPDNNAQYIGSATYNFTITKAQLEKVELKQTSFEYTGSVILPEPKNDATYDINLMSASGEFDGTDAGNYKITISLDDKENYEWADGTTTDLELKWSITKVTPTIEISNLSQKVGSVTAPSCEVTPAVTSGDVTVEYKLSTAEDTAYTTDLPTEAGTYNVKVSVSGDKNLNDTSKVETLTITKTTTGGGGGSSSTTTYTITVKENKNAEVTPNGTVKVEKGDDKTFTIKAKDGYEIEDVLVDGKSVGAVSKYTFENVKAKHTLEVKVKEEEKTTTPEVKETFKDVKKDDWYFEAVEYVAKKGLMNGTGNDEFSPNATTTRGMIVTILYRLEGEPAVEECSFTDVPSDAYYAKAIAWAEKNGIVLGLGESKFGPDQEITREQLATIMYRYSIYKKYDTSVGEDTNILSYNDIQDLAEYAFPAMQYACGEGLISGMGNGNLEPKGNATRAQLATILMRYCEKYMK